MLSLGSRASLPFSLPLGSRFSLQQSSPRLTNARKAKSKTSKSKSKKRDWSVTE